MARPEVGLLVDSRTGYGRGILRGVHAVAVENDWVLWAKPPDGNLPALTYEWDLKALICHAEQVPYLPDNLRASPVIVAIGQDSTPVEMSYAAIDDAAVGVLAAEHLMSHQLETFAGVGFNSSPFARRRIDAFRHCVEAAGKRYIDALDHMDSRLPLDSLNRADKPSLRNFLERLPRPCGVFAACDEWAIIVLRHCRLFDVRVPEDVQVIGADDDSLLCEVADPPLSSVAIPWYQMGYELGQLAISGMSGRGPAVSRVIRPTSVAPRRSTDAIPIDDEDVAAAMAAIKANACGGAQVAEVARGVAVSRRSLERRFHKLVGRTMGQELRRQRVEAARRLILNTDLPMSQIAARAGFSSQVKLAAACRKELGARPTDLRKQARLR